MARSEGSPFLYIDQDGLRREENMTSSARDERGFSGALVALDGNGKRAGAFRSNVIRQLARQIVAELVDVLAASFSERLKAPIATDGGDAIGIDREEEALAKADMKAGKILRKVQIKALNSNSQDLDEEDEDEINVEGAQFPNLKYAKPKYKNIHSLLRYIESPSEAGGVKLVIMNFND
jgi:hypothetical protein